jgi:DNA-binding MarR family transcriptional regulator
MPDLPESTVYLLKRAELAVRGCVELALAEADLTPSQYFILLLVKYGDASSSAELARAMGVLPQSMTELIAPLEQRGAILRRPDPANNRILRIELTADGEKIFAKGTEIAIRIERELLAGFDTRERARLNRAFTDLIAQAEAHSYHPNLRRLSKARQRLTNPQAADKPVRPGKKAIAKRRATSRR